MSTRPRIRASVFRGRDDYEDEDDCCDCARRALPLRFRYSCRSINPVYRKPNGRWIIGSESRQRTFAAVKEVLLTGGGASDLRSAVAITLGAAPRHGAEIRHVWRHVRRYRDQIHNQVEQLELPI